MVKKIRAVAVVCLAALALTAATGAASANSKYAGIVVDAKTGKVLYESNADAPRYPASLTKIMTLYIVFEELEAGRLKLGSRLSVSKYAAARPPSKLGLKAGSTISVRDAISALVTKSANDIATAISENISGSQDAFARRMTSTARRLGMSRTTFRNASGLPDSAQKTTARDMALLGRAIQEHFPKYYKYFSMRTFSFKGRKYGNHNRLLGRVKGVDGIKTGYTRASGFNLVTSVRHRDRHIVAVVMGGRTGRSRNEHMQKLIASYLPKATTGRRTAPLVAGRSINRGLDLAKAPLPAAKPDVVLAFAGGEVPLPPRLVQASADAGALPAAKAETDAAAAALPPMPPILPPMLPMTPAARVSAAHQTELPQSANSADVPLHVASLPPVRKETEVDQGSTDQDEEAAEAPAVPQPAPPLPVSGATVKKTSVPEGWHVQIAAAASEEAALEMLREAQKKTGKMLSQRALYTEPVEANGQKLYRARFAGFESKQAAWAACKSLKKANYGCYAVNP